MIGRTKRKAGLSYFRLNSTRKTIYITGGSQGAKGFNSIIGRTLKELKNYNLIWSCGKANYAECSRMVKGRKNIVLRDFIEKREFAFAAADLAISRAGASTLSDIKASRLPAVLVPFPFATDDHQYYNAREMEEAGVARVIRESELTSELLVRTIGIIFRQYRDFVEGYGRMNTAGVNERIVQTILAAGQKNVR